MTGDARCDSIRLLHAELEPSFFKSNFDNEEVATFFDAKLALPENHIRLADSGVLSRPRHTRQGEIGMDAIRVSQAADSSSG
jgi:hypothetical protein